MEQALSEARQSPNNLNVLWWQLCLYRCHRPCLLDPFLHLIIAKRIRQRPLRPKVHAPEEFPEEDSGEEDISLFLHYFSAFGIASNGETTTAPVPSSPPRQTTDEQTRDIENVGVTEATLEMSKSLAQVRPKENSCRYGSG